MVIYETGSYLRFGKLILLWRKKKNASYPSPPISFRPLQPLSEVLSVSGHPFQSRDGGQIKSPCFWLTRLGRFSAAKQNREHSGKSAKEEG